MSLACTDSAIATSASAARRSGPAIRPRARVRSVDPANRTPLGQDVTGFPGGQGE